MLNFQKNLEICLKMLRGKDSPAIEVYILVSRPFMELKFNTLKAKVPEWYTYTGCLCKHYMTLLDQPAVKSHPALMATAHSF